MTSYGKKGGTGATAGKRAHTFKATFEGETFTKKVFQDIDGPAVMQFYRHRGKVYANTVFPADAIPGWARDSLKAPAERVS